MSVLITGGTGFLGSKLAEQLANKGGSVVLYDKSPNLENIKAIRDKVTVIRGDFTPPGGPARRDQAIPRR